MKIDELTLGSIDSMRHLATSEEIVHAVMFPVRLGYHRVHTAYRFVSAVVMTDSLSSQRNWPEILEAVVALEKAGGELE